MRILHSKSVELNAQVVLTTNTKRNVRITKDKNALSYINNFFLKSYYFCLGISFKSIDSSSFLFSLLVLLSLRLLLLLSWLHSPIGKLCIKQEKKTHANVFESHQGWHLPAGPFAWEHSCMNGCPLHCRDKCAFVWKHLHARWVVPVWERCVRVYRRCTHLLVRSHSGGGVVFWKPVRVKKKTRCVCVCVCDQEACPRRRG